MNEKRDWFDWMNDNFGKVVIGFIVVMSLLYGSFVYLLASQSHEIARNVGALARDAKDGYSKP